jgi:hypothetical protein
MGITEHKSGTTHLIRLFVMTPTNVPFSIAVSDTTLSQVQRQYDSMEPFPLSAFKSQEYRD